MRAQICCGAILSNNSGGCCAYNCKLRVEVIQQSSVSGLRILCYKVKD
jgi:hypothetical protein